MVFETTYYRAWRRPSAGFAGPLTSPLVRPRHCTYFLDGFSSTSSKWLYESYRL